MLRPLPLVACLIALHGNIPVPTAESATPETSGHATADPLATAVEQVLAEAEKLGLTPLPANATIWLEKEYRDPRQSGWSHPMVHARLPDGRWLEGLINERSADAIPAERVKSFTAMSGETCTSVAPAFYSPYPALFNARLHQLGDANALEQVANSFSTRIDFTGLGQWRLYPRAHVAAATDPADILRLDVSDWFLQRSTSDVAQAARWRAAALAILPVTVREAQRQRMVRDIQVKDAPVTPLRDDEIAPTDPWNALSHIDRTHLNPTIDAVPAISDDALVALIGDTRATPGGAGEALGDTALNVLVSRWGFDPRTVTHRPWNVPWDDAERQAVATAVQAWWKDHRTNTVTQRIAAVIACASWSDMANVIARHLSPYPRWFYNEKPSKHQTAITFPPQPELFAAIQPVLAERLRQPGDHQTDASSIRIVLALTHGDTPHADIVTALATWPRTGHLASVLAEWDDVLGQHDAYDHLMDQWWAADRAQQYTLSSFGADVAKRMRPSPRNWYPDDLLSGWIERPTPARWQRMQDCLRTDDQSIAALRFRFAIGTFFHPSPYALKLSKDPLLGCRAPLAWLGLADSRPLPAVLIASLPTHDGPPLANDLRWCDVVLANLHQTWGWHTLSIQQPEAVKRLARGRQNISLLTLSRDDRDTLITAIRPTLAPFARSVLDRYHLDLPAELAACTTPTIADPGLTADERSACEAVWKQAVELGLPDLTGAAVQRGPYRYANNKDDQHQPLIHLSDGTWLVQDGIDVPAERIVTSGETLRQPPTADNNQGYDGDRRLTTSDQMRLRLNAIGRINTDGYWVPPGIDLLTALAWWRSGSDPQGRALVYALLQSGAKSPEPISLSGYGGSTIVPPATPPTLADRLRLALVRLCRSRAIWAIDRSDTVRWAEIARALVPPTERTAWEEPFSILIRRWDIPAKPSPTADFAARLQCWDEWHRDPRTGKRLDSIKRPAERKDTDALIALLGDDRPSRWLDNDVMPRALGDVALRALCEIWRCDWRLVACHDPVTVQALGAKPSEGPREQPWTPALRHQVAASLQRWWQDAAHRDPDALYAAALPWLSIGNLDDLIKEHRRELGPLSADACAEIMRRNPLSNDREWLSPAHIFAMVCFPRHAGLDAALATWPTTPDITTLRGFRSALAGDAAQLDAWFDVAFAHSTAPERGWNSSPMHALRNLGLLTAAPTPARRDRVVALLAQPEDGPVLHELLPLLGQPYWPDLFGITKAPTASAIPAAVAMAALDDRRPAPSVEEPYHLEWKFREAMQRLATANAPRICDATAAALIAERKAWDLEPLPDGVDKDAKRFLGRPVAERDKAIAVLKDAMQDVVREAAEKVGWITTKTQADGNRF